MTFLHSRRGVLTIGPAALATMRAHEQHAPNSLEAGGVLLGRLIRGCRDVVVDRVTTPQPSDVRTRFTFDRKDEHQRFITGAWAESGGTVHFLGDWHTHAEAWPEPSPVDVESWARMLREDIHDNEACFFVIVGQKSIRCFEGDRATGAITRLQGRRC